MPFTLAHIVIASPISKISNNTLPIAALAIGSMTPDLFRLFSNSVGLETHTWSAIFYPNLFLGLVFCGLWYGLFRPTTYACLALKDDLNVSSFLSFLKFVTAICIALILGNTTHILWDGFTHLDSRTLIRSSILESSVSLFNRQFSYYFILQILSSILPFPFIFWMAYHYYKKHHIKNLITQNQQKFILYALTFSLISGFIATGFYISNISYDIWLNHQYYFLGRMINKFSQAALLCVSFCFIIYQLKYVKKKY